MVVSNLTCAYSMRLGFLVTQWRSIILVIDVVSMWTSGKCCKPATTSQHSSKPTIGFIYIYIYIQLQVALIFADDYTMAKNALCLIIQLEKRIIELTMTMGSENFKLESF